MLINASLILVNRSFSLSLLLALVRLNRFLWLLVAVILTAALSWSPAMSLFRFGSLHLDDLALAVAAGVSVPVLLELVKPLWRAGFRS